MADADLLPLVESLRQARVLCVGDIMLDHYIYGRVERVSPEAPIPVLHIEHEVKKLGGAGNVVANLHSLGAEACAVAVTGDDPAGRKIAELLAALDGVGAPLITEAGRVTTVKTRYIAETQQLLRADREHAVPLGEAARGALLAKVREALASCRVVALSDYAKGVFADGLAGEIIAAARAAGRIVVVDPKGTDYSRYRGATLIKPNRRELAEATQKTVESAADIAAAARSLITAHGFEAVLVSLSRDGMLLIESSGASHALAAEAREVFDVSGAGDTVVATLAAALGAGVPLREAARLANVAAGIVVAKVGTAAVHADELAAALIDRDALATRKRMPLSAALDRVARWRRNGLTVGFTNGCFDLLHPGHVSLLSEARAACDRLVVGLNSDASVARLKGPGRPAQTEEARAQVLSSLASVDLVVVFDEDTPRDLIAALRPDVLVKGADYRLDQVVGADIVQSYGGKVLLAEIVPGHSTTATLARIAR
jgi:D-beta-D-heptose 7-phosphate kinase / D-beta-D-heptose 1-phosphate adenosyltransferase